MANILCGACQQWGDSPMIKEDICTICNRSESEIMNDHGKVNLTKRESEIIKNQHHSIGSVG